jgi:hypothetical protein
MAAIADFGVLRATSYENGHLMKIYSVPVAIRQRLSPPPQQLFRMPDALLETIRARFETVLNGPAAGGGLDPGGPMEAYQNFGGGEFHTQTWTNGRYYVELIFLNGQHKLRIFRSHTSPQEQQALRPVFESIANGFLQEFAASVPPAAGGRRRSRKTRKQRRRMSRRRVR